MKIPFTDLDWTKADKTEHPGETGVAIWQSLHFEGLRVRKVFYSPGYVSDHWCEKGHLVHCISGEFISEQKNEGRIVFRTGMTYLVTDGETPHKSSSPTGAELLIIDGTFLKNDFTQT